MRDEGVGGVAGQLERREGRRCAAGRRGRLLVARVRYFLARRGTQAERDAGAVRDQGEGPAARYGAALVGGLAAQADGRLQFGTGPVEVALAEREDTQLVLEIGLFTHISGELRGLDAGAQHALPVAPVQSGGEGGRRGAREVDGGALLAVAGRCRRRQEGDERGEQGVRLGAHARGRDRGVPGPPGVVQGGDEGTGRDVVAVSGGLQLGLDAGGEPIAGADRGDQSAGREFAEGGVRVGVADERGQMRLVRHLAAERDGEAQGGPGRGAEPGGEQRRGRGGLTEGRQGYGVDLVERRGVEGLVDRGRVLEDAELLDGAGADAQLVALPEQGAGLDEAQGQALGLEVEVARPVRLLLGEDAAHGTLQDLHGAGPGQAAEEDLLDRGVRGRCRDLRGRGDQERALGRRVEEFVEGGGAELDVVQDDDRADLPRQREEFLPAGPVQGAS